MTPKITVQLYSVRDLAKQDYAGTIRAIAETGFGNVEPAGYPGTTAKDAAKLFKELGLNAPSAHIGLPVGDAKNAIIEEALLMGHKYLITGCPPKFNEHYTSLDKVKAMAELYCEADANVAPHGLQVGYHNHDWDLSVVDGRRSYQVFLENTPRGFSTRSTYSGSPAQGSIRRHSSGRSALVARYSTSRTASSPTPLPSRRPRPRAARSWSATRFPSARPAQAKWT